MPITLARRSADVARATAAALLLYVPDSLVLMIAAYDIPAERAIAELDAPARAKAVALGLRDLPNVPIVFVQRDGPAQLISMIFLDAGEPSIVSQRRDPRPIWRPDLAVHGMMNFINNNTYQDAALSGCNTHDVVIEKRALRDAGDLEFECTAWSFGLHYSQDDYKSFAWGGLGYPAWYPPRARIDIPYGIAFASVPL